MHALGRGRAGLRAGGSRPFAPSHGYEDLLTVRDGRGEIDEVERRFGSGPTGSRDCIVDSAPLVQPVEARRANSPDDVHQELSSLRRLGANDGGLQDLLVAALRAESEA